MNNENFPRQLSKVKVTVNSNLNSIGLSLPVLNIFSHVCILFIIKTGELYSYHCEHLFIYISLCLLNYFRICGAQETLQCIDKGYLEVN